MNFISIYNCVNFNSILNFRPTIKLDNDLECLVDTLAHLKKYSTVKNILNMMCLNNGTAIKKTFDDHFKIAVQK